MHRKSESLHLDIRANRKGPYALLRNSYREDGKVKKETICSIRGLSVEQLRTMQAAMQGKTMMKDDFNISNSREYGASFVCVELMRELELDRAIYSRPAEEWVRSSLAMIAGRLVYAGSKLSLSHCGEHSSLWDICGIKGGIDVNVHCYEAMDKLYTRQDAIQKKLAEKHMNGGSLVLYDITSSYMEGKYVDSDIVEFGYNRDRKRSHEQIVISLLCNKEGCPVAVEVFSGNTKDETTVLDKVKEIQRKYGLDRVIFVGDRGMVTKAKYEELDHNLVKVITALNHGAIKTLCENKVIQLSMFDEKSIVEVIDGDVRYCLCKNPDMAKRKARHGRAFFTRPRRSWTKSSPAQRKANTAKVYVPARWSASSIWASSLYLKGRMTI